MNTKPVAAFATMGILLWVCLSQWGCRRTAIPHNSVAQQAPQTPADDDDLAQEVEGDPQDWGVAELETNPVPVPVTKESPLVPPAGDTQGRTSPWPYIENGRVVPQWPLQVMEIEKAWEMLSKKGKKPGEGVKISILDTGFMPHPFNLLPGAVPQPPGDRPPINDPRVVWGRNYVEPGDAPWDRPSPLTRKTPFYGHGTGAVSVIMAPGKGKVTGISWASTFAFYRVGRIVFVVRPTHLTQAIYDAVREGAHVVNISMGGLGSKKLRHAVEFAEKNGVIVVAAAGQNVKKVAWPAQYPTVVSAAAITPWGTPWELTARGPQVKIAVPAAYVYCNSPQKKGVLTYDTVLSQGTTFAAMYTSGVAALWLSYWGRDQLVKRYGAERIPEIFRRILREQGFSERAGWNTREFGPGILNARRVLEAPLP